MSEKKIVHPLAGFIGQFGNEYCTMINELDSEIDGKSTKCVMDEGNSVEAPVVLSRGAVNMDFSCIAAGNVRLYGQMTTAPNMFGGLDVTTDKFEHLLSMDSFGEQTFFGAAVLNDDRTVDIITISFDEGQDHDEDSIPFVQRNSISIIGCGSYDWCHLQRFDDRRRAEPRIQSVARAIKDFKLLQERENADSIKALGKVASVCRCILTPILYNNTCL